MNWLRGLLTEGALWLVVRLNRRPDGEVAVRLHRLAASYTTRRFGE